MHTVDMKDYGEANLGTRGMALFFSSHVCSPLCEMLGEWLPLCETTCYVFTLNVSVLRCWVSDYPLCQMGNYLYVKLGTFTYVKPPFPVNHRADPV